ncbi:biofilm/acid-resistance regulator YmgB/AriR, partial [Salmonella enterica]|uniref:biofilm/acid-resistance regulator YmgB/AriR n=1 Tax=Salmonella enterica TaxID=28901 RepID=UPI003F78C203
MTTITLVNEQNSTGNPFSAHMLCEQRAIQEITYELLQSQQHVSNKDIIAKLIEKLETEKDVVQLDIYRNALEAVLFQAPHVEASALLTNRGGVTPPLFIP